MRRFTLTLALVGAATLGTAVLAGAAPPVQDYHAELETLNQSGVSGFATLHLEGSRLTVSVEATGLVPDMTHAQHIHGSPPSKGPASKGNSTCPGIEADTSGDGIVQVGEGLPSYGPVLLPLTPFQQAPEGTIEYQNTFTVDARDLGPLQNRSIVIHGLATDDPSTPVACGQIEVTPGN